MNVTYDKLNDVTGKIVITLEENDYADKVKKELRKIGESRPEPGFRPGHTPEGLLRRKYGKSVKYDVINETVSDALSNYINDNKLRVLGNPMPKRSEDFNIENKDFTFEFEVGLAPEIDVKIDKEMHIPYYTIEVSEEMLDNQDKALRRRLGKQEPGDTVNEDALVKGVITELNEDGTVKEGGIVQENGIVAPKYFKNEEQRQLFMGKHVGDEIVFNPAATCDSNPTELSSMLGIDKGEVDAHTGNFRFDVKEIIVLNPAELGQEYYDEVFGKDQVHDEEEYRKALKEMIAQQLVADSNYRFSIDARDVITKAAGKVELPDEVLKAYLRMNNENLNDENIDKVYAEAAEDLIWQLIEDQFAEKEGLKLEEGDLKEVARLMARNEFAKYGMTSVPEETLDKYADQILADQKVRERVARDAFNMKVFSKIHDVVTLDNKDVTVDEFNALFNTGEKPAEA